MDLAVNDLARSYQPRRVWAAAISIGWNLLVAALFVGSGGAERLYKHFVPLDPAYFPAAFSWVAPVYFSIFFAGYAILNFPLELWFGYLEERQFGLAKEGVRAWARDWLIGTIQHGAMFLIGASLILIFQVLAPAAWLALTALTLLILFLATTYLAADLIPLGLFHLEPADPATVNRLYTLLAPPDDRPAALALPPLIVYSHPGLREFAGGIMGLGNRCVMLISRATIERASDKLLRFVLLHDLGHLAQDEDAVVVKRLIVLVLGLLHHLGGLGHRLLRLVAILDEGLQPLVLELLGGRVVELQQLGPKRVLLFVSGAPRSRHPGENQ
jgi:hypothetical protein